MTPTTWFMATRRLRAGSAGFKSWVNDATVTPARRSASPRWRATPHGPPVANLKVTWTWTFGNGRVIKTTAITNANGKAVSSLPITTSMRKGLVRITAHVQSGEHQPDVDDELPPLLSPSRPADGRYDVADAQPCHPPTRIAGIDVPQDDISAATWAWAHRSLPDYLLTHSVRAYCWGAAIAAGEGGRSIGRSCGRRR